MVRPSIEQTKVKTLRKQISCVRYILHIDRSVSLSQSPSQDFMYIIIQVYQETTRTIFFP